MLLALQGEVVFRLMAKYSTLAHDAELDAQDALQKKLDETSVVIEEIRNLKSIKSSIEKFEKAASLQNSKLDNLANAIRQLAQAKVSGANDIKTLDDSTQNKSKKTFNTAVLVFSGILVLLFIIANWDYIYSIIYDIFSL